MSDIKKNINRRSLIKGMSIAGVGSALLAYQNCAPTVQFASMKSTNIDGLGVVDPPVVEDPNACVRALSIYDTPSAWPEMGPKVKSTLVGPSPVGEAAEHNPNARFYRAKFYDHASSSQKDQYLLTVDVGSMPSAGVYHMVGSSNMNNTNIVTDIYVFNPDSPTEPLLFWKRFGGSDHAASAMFLLSPMLVQQKAKLIVVAHCLAHGFFLQEVDLGATPLEYSTAVGTWVANTPFGSSSILRPYLSVDATGGQGNLGAGHAPAFTNVTDGKVEAVFGSPTAKHGQASSNHYMAGALLFDQNSNLLASPCDLSFKDAADHKFIFDNLKLAERGVKALRIVVMDTYNGYFQGFRTL